MKIVGIYYNGQVITPINDKDKQKKRKIMAYKDEKTRRSRTKIMANKSTEHYKQQKERGRDGVSSIYVYSKKRMAQKENTDNSTEKHYYTDYMHLGNIGGTFLEDINTT